MRLQLPITYESVSLRRVESSDYDDLLEYHTNPAVYRYQFGDPMTHEQVGTMIEEQMQIRPGSPGVALMLVVIPSGQTKVVGDCQITITSADDRQGEIGFTVNPNWQGRGIATMAVSAVTEFAFAQLHLHRIVAATDVRNVGSWKVMERAGMRREAHYRHDAFVKGEWVDDYLYAILDDEWRSKARTGKEIAATDGSK